MAATKIAIVGAGLGGLAAALFLRRAELNVVVYEQSTALHEIGAGIVVPPNMVRLLRRLDLAKKLDEFAVRLEFAWEYRRWQDGRVLSATPMGERCELMYGAPCYVAHRADLREFFRRALPDEAVRFDHRCIGVKQSKKGVRPRARERVRPHSSSGGGRRDRRRWDLFRDPRFRHGSRGTPLFRLVRFSLSCPRRTRA